MKACMVAPLGMSPPVVCEVYEALLGLGERITDVVLLCTQEEDIKRSAVAVEAGLSSRYPHTHVHTVWLPFEDIRREEDMVYFMRTCASVIRREREVYGCERVLLNLTGGRKGTCLVLSLLGQMLDVDGVLYAVHFESKSYNISLERARQLVNELYDSSDRMAFYEEHREELDSVLFPPHQTYRVLRIPCIPYPREYLGRLVAVLCADGVRAEECGLPEEHLARLERVGLIAGVEGRLYPSDLGRALSSIWR